MTAVSLIQNPLSLVPLPHQTTMHKKLVERKADIGDEFQGSWRRQSTRSQCPPMPLSWLL